MAILQIRSDNPKFSFLLKKNPEGIMQVKSVRQGTLFGFYSKNNIQEFNCFFKDGEDEVSYKTFLEEEYEYMNTSRYNAAMFPLNAIQEFFEHMIKKDNPEDPDNTFNNEITINLMEVTTRKYIELFQTHFKDYQMTAEEVGFKNYKITITTKRSFKHLLSYVNLFAAFNVLKLKTYDIDLKTEQNIVKYLNSLTIIDAPYFIRYCFKVNLLRSPTNMEKYRSIVENSSLYKIEMGFGNTTLMRRNAILEKIDRDLPVVDIGAGEGFFLKSVTKAAPSYYAIDIDEDCRKALEKKIKANNITNAKVFESYDDYLKEINEPTMVLMVEVIEHMSKEDATKLITKVLDNPNALKILISTPNQNFNKYYDFEEEDMRHEDHHFELPEQEFKTWIGDIVMSCGGYKMFNVKVDGIGDKVDGCAVSMLCQIERI